MPELLRNMTVGNLKFCLHCNSSLKPKCHMVAFQFSQIGEACVFWQEYIMRFDIVTSQKGV